MPKIYYVYILASQRRVLHVGITSNIEHRVFQHKTHTFKSFTAKYNITTLVYFERHGAVMSAIRREKEMKAWRREEKIQLIESTNPKWKDLSYGWYQRHRYQPDLKALELKRQYGSVYLRQEQSSKDISSAEMYPGGRSSKKTTAKERAAKEIPSREMSS